MVHPKGADNMAVSGLSLRKTLIGSGWVTSVLLCTNRQSSHLARHQFLTGRLFSTVWTSSCWLRAVTIASSLMGGCGLSHKHVEDGYKSTCVKFGG